MKTYLLILLLAVLLINSSSVAGSNSDGIAKSVKLASSYEVIVREMKIRKLLVSGADVLDYRDPGANPVHDPGKGKTGGRATIP